MPDFNEAKRRKDRYAEKTYPHVIYNELTYCLLIDHRWGNQTSRRIHAERSGCPICQNMLLDISGQWDYLNDMVGIQRVAGPSVGD